MQASDHIADPYDLTGQVALPDYMPEFEGNYSMVFRGDFKGKSVAVKVIKATGEPKSVRRKVLRERTIWASLLHPNIHPYYGFADDPEFGRVRAPYGAMISPWYNNGDAAKFLEESGKRMPIDDRVKIWKGVIEGVVYLHSQTPVIVHGDLKPGNILIDNAGNPRICDFGLAHIFFDEPGSGLTTTTEHTGTERYLSPELVIDDADVRPTTASDVYALGCLGLDVIYLQKPYSHRKNNARGIIFADIRKGVPPATGLSDLLPGHYSLLKACWSREPDARPSALIMAQTLTRGTLVVPPEIIDRIIGFASEISESWYNCGEAFAWRMRTRDLLTLSLVSKEFKKLTVPYLYGDIRFMIRPRGISSPRLLLSTLEANLESAVTGDWRYQSYTKSLIYSAVSPSVKSSPVDFDTLRVLIQSFDTLKSIRVEEFGFETYFMNPYATFLRSQPVGASALLTSVTFAGQTLCNIMQGLKAFQDLQMMQELRIISAIDNSQPDRFSTSGLLLPRLESLTIDGTFTSLDFLLSELSRCHFPLLESFFLISRGIGSELRPYLQDFVLSHGPQLRTLMCDTAGYSPHPLSSVLHKCPNLRSISYPIWSSELPLLYYKHLSLVNIKLLYLLPYHAFGASRIEPQDLLGFGLSIREVYPHLSTILILHRSVNRTLRYGEFSNIEERTVLEWDGINATDAGEIVFKDLLV